MNYEEYKEIFEKLLEECVTEAIDQAKQKWIESLRPEMTFEELKKLSQDYDSDLKRFFSSVDSMVAYKLRKIADQIRARPTRKD